MKINFETVRWKNVLSYGNKISEFDFEHGIDLVVGENGLGKCLRKNTTIDINFGGDTELEKKFKEFIDQIGEINDSDTRTSL